MQVTYGAVNGVHGVVHGVHGVENLFQYDEPGRYEGIVCASRKTEDSSRVQHGV